MYWILNGVIFIGTFFLMEFVAWAAHKYVMHGFLWSLHKDHHVKEPGFFEKNDAFFLIFAIPSWLSIMFGMIYQVDLLVAAGLGILAYGIAYFLVHEVFIHQRFKWLRNANSTYFRAVRRAHKMHHKHLTKEDGESFGMLVFPFKYWREEKRKTMKLSKSS